MLTPNEHIAIDFDYAYSRRVHGHEHLLHRAGQRHVLTGTTSPYFAGAASVNSSGAPLTCPTSATNSTPTQWLARAFMDAPSQYGSVGVMVNPNDKVQATIWATGSARSNGNQFFTDAREVNGSLNSQLPDPVRSASTGQSARA